jgi:hypothetical protein
MTSYRSGAPAAFFRPHPTELTHRSTSRRRVIFRYFPRNGKQDFKHVSSRAHVEGGREVRDQPSAVGTFPHPRLCGMAVARH